jgi:hypothetical protein
MLHIVGVLMQIGSGQQRMQQASGLRAVTS